MKHLAIAAAACAGGCLWATPKSQVVHGYAAEVALGDDGHLEGGALHVGGGQAGVGADLEVSLHDARRTGDPATYHALGLGLSLRASLFGVLGTEHVLDRYFDLGAEAGVGGALALGVPPHDVAGLPSGWVGAWTELGTFEVADGYLALTGGIRAETSGEPWVNRTQLMIGLAWRHRRQVTAEDLRFRD